MKVTLFWFRRDLRIFDNTALFEAINYSKNVLPVYIFDSEIHSEYVKNDHRVNFIYDELLQINQEFNKNGGSLILESGNTIEVFDQIFSKYEVEALFFNREYEPLTRERDNKVYKLCKEKGVELHSFKDQVVFEPNEILKKDGNPYTVYTPYKKKWREAFKATKVKEVKLQNRVYKINLDFPTLEQLGFEKSTIKIKPYTLQHNSEYHENRDFPAKDYGSYLSPHLRYGTVSVRDIILKNKNDTFLDEIIWRSFFMQVLFHFPNSANTNFREKYNFIQWRNDIKEFEAWKEGKTGYSMVDAGMKELNQTGYMHNRVRMVCAGFLCKHLLIDWRWGERYFAEKLFDYDLSANIGNWQWSAGTGCDAAPYFRVFNPITQQKKFDPKFEYTRKWAPEYLEAILPQPIVEHSFARNRALETYKIGLAKA